MKYFHASFALLLLSAGSALSEFTHTVTGTKDGKRIDASDIVLEPYEPSLHRLERSTGAGAGAGAAPRDRGHRVKRTNPTYYSANWCGAVQHSVSSNKITSVYAYFQVPTLSQRPGVSTFPQYVASWVGIDGATWSSALLQSGVTSQLSSTGVQTNWAWYEWIPDSAHNLVSFPVATGDFIEVTISASSSTSGTITISNLDQSVTNVITVNNGTALGRVDADWILETPATSGGYLPLARFTDTWFQDCSVSTSNGTTKGVNGATMYFMSGNKCTSTQYDNGNFWDASS